MNPAQYKQAMRQRQLERRAELLSKCEGLGFTHPPRKGKDSSSVKSIDIDRARHQQQHGLFVSKLKLHGEDSEGGSAATSLASSAGGGGMVEGFGVRGSQLGQAVLHSTEDGLSPLAPGPLSNPWDNLGNQLAGFDKQAEVKRTETGGGSEPPGDLWDEGENDLNFGNELHQGQQQPRGARVLDWDDKLPGETTITQGVRLYLSSVYPDASHEENCALVLLQVLEQVALEELDVPVLKTRHTIKIEAFLRSVVLSVPARTWQQSVRGAFARTAPAGMTASPGHGHQISKEELTFRMSLFVAMMKAEREGTDDADIAVREVCRQIVTDYEARAKLWMSPAQNAERFLQPLVMEFASWLRANRDILYQGSATEGLLRSIDEGLRSSLKNQVYRSAEHFLEVLKSLSSSLTDMPLPSYDPSGGDDHPFDVSQSVRPKRVKDKEDVRASRSVPVDQAVDHTSRGPDGCTRCPAASPSGVRVPGEGGRGGGPVQGGVGGTAKDGDGAVAAKSALETYVDQCAWRVLHAASRTASGGDSFFVVQDLFGGEGVLVKMATAPTEPIRIRTKGLAVRVTTVDKHDIYHISDVDMTTSEASPRPLMTITSTMKEIIQFAPFVEHPVLVRRKSGLIAEGNGSDIPAEPSNRQQQPSHARSGRFITISADLPDYPEGHLDASAGLLLASSQPSPPNTVSLDEQTAGMLHVLLAC
ncbi:expressed unknown protein [Ectocarpus siliculosus]|uniref:Uncharacterized protein n=1 Tax=Ectocarpus siliculosus TaxID=2880 RepID=D7FY37_ECTSI|nr:expressed unknown protein [Ectocarpus siliculosus]|eukprot:CBJ32450.1 expressed unknown protein [Ectocarpus siliculosus]